MSDFLTHILVADAVLDRIESRRILEGVTKKRSLYYLGAQGPDPLFFYNFSHKGKGQLKDLGKIMHREKTGEFLLDGFKRLQSISYDKNWTDLAVYLCGFISHFNLDRTIHPYVYWATDHWIWGTTGTPRTASHQEVETALDVLYWLEYKKMPAYRVRTRRLVDIGHHWPDGVEVFLKEAFKNIYGIEAGQKEINKILLDFYAGHDLLYDPRGWKKSIVYWLEEFTGGGIKPPKHPYPVTCDATIDWANKKKRTWFNPFAHDETYNLSVDELLAQAADTAATHINTLFSRIFRKESIEDLFPNISYITGFQCH